MSSYAAGMENAIGIALAVLVGLVVQYWVIRLAVRHAMADASSGRGGRSTFAGVKLEPAGDSAGQTEA